MAEEIIQGIAASPGIVVSTVFVLDSEEIPITKRRIREADVPREIQRFKAALMKTRTEILAIKKKVADQMNADHAEIFSAHLLIFEDSIFIDEIIDKVRQEKLCIEYLFFDVMKRYIYAFMKSDDEYLKERVSDLHDVTKRVLNNLIGSRSEVLASLTGKVVVVAYDLSPSDTACMHKKDVAAFVTDIGGKTSHTAIMAKSLEIPAVVGLEVITKKVKHGDQVIVDGYKGAVILHPTKRTIKRYELQRKHLERREKALISVSKLPSQTRDGRKVDVSANIELPEEVPSALRHGADGIGLYRTEYFYMNRKGLPTEEEHFQAYKRVAEEIFPKSVVIRTLDLGGDKFLSSLEVPREMNPFMGWRAIRFCLEEQEIFRTQLRAILRASAYGKIRMMYPMITGIDEVRQANAIVRELRHELDRKKVPYDRGMEVGVMIEVPSAAMTSDILAREVDFFSIGTNDLIQYSLAVDRVNEKIAYLYDPAHPAVLRLIRSVVENAHAAGIRVGMCGEMAGELVFSPLLLGLGLDELSMPSIMIPEVKKLVSELTMEGANDIVRSAMGMSSGKEIEVYLRAQLKKIMPEFCTD